MPKDLIDELDDVQKMALTDLMLAKDIARRVFEEEKPTPEMVFGVFDTVINVGGEDDE